MQCGEQPSSHRCHTEVTPHESTKLHEAAGQNNCVLRLFRKGKVNAQHSTRSCLPPAQHPCCWKISLGITSAPGQTMGRRKADVVCTDYKHDEPELSNTPSLEAAS